MGIFKIYADRHEAQKSYDFDQTNYEKRINNLGFFDDATGRCAALTCLWLSRYKRKDFGNPRQIKHETHSFKVLTGYKGPETTSVLNARTECANMVNEKQNLNDTKRKELKKTGELLKKYPKETQEYRSAIEKINNIGHSGGCSFSFLKQTMNELCPGVGTGQLTWNDEQQSILQAHERDKLAANVTGNNGRYYVVTLDHAHGIIVDNSFFPQDNNDGVFKFFDPNHGSATFNQSRLFEVFLKDYFANRVFWNTFLPADEDLKISYVKCDI